MVSLFVLSGIYPPWFCIIAGTAINILIALMLHASDEDF